MTPTDSVRVPREPTQRMMRAGADRWIEAIDEAVTRKGEEEAARCAWAAMLAAAPAPAGSHRSTHHVWRDLASVTESWPCYCGAETDHVIGNEATPQPEQGAGLPEQWKEAAAIYREQGRNDISDVFDDCASALARQQSRVVDAYHVEDLRTVAREMREVVAGLDFDQNTDLEIWAIRIDEFLAAMEGVRDGQEG